MQDDTQHNHSTMAASTPLWKDLLIPVSIIIAGIFIGAGLYFGGGQSGAQAVVDTQPVAAKPVDNTGKVAPVTDADHVRGDLNAPIKIVEYSDADCPFCARFHDTMQEIVAEQDGIAWVYRHFPLEQLHPLAPTVAVASECVAELGGKEAFWSFTDDYIETRGSGDRTEHEVLILDLVAQVGVSEAAFTECMDSQRMQATVQEDLNNAVETGGRGTPWSIIIGPSGKTYPLNGALPKAAILQLIETARAEA